MLCVSRQQDAKFCVSSYMHLEDYWRGLLLLTKRMRAWSEPVDFCFINVAEPTPEVHINRRPVPKANATLVLVIVNPEVAIEHPQATIFYLEGSTVVLDYEYQVEEEIVEFLATYLPYCFLSLRARQQQRAVTIAHFAQSLDGKIATQEGHSRWIGNEENLVHAHRMRALCDSILIGSRTLNADHPALTVRLVEGENPRKVVLCSTEGDFSSLRAESSSSVLVIGTGEDPCVENATYCQLPSGENDRIASNDILRHLYAQGLYTVYVEGGATTTSYFLQEGAVDILQLHVAPLIFGSGLDSFSLPGITTVDEAIRFAPFYYKPIGDAFMFVGEVSHA